MLIKPSLISSYTRAVSNGCKLLISNLKKKKSNGVPEYGVAEQNMTALSHIGTLVDHMDWEREM
jgi:hypothetical protein